VNHRWDENEMFEEALAHDRHVGSDLAFARFATVTSVPAVLDLLAAARVVSGGGHAHRLRRLAAARRSPQRVAVLAATVVAQPGITALLDLLVSRLTEPYCGRE
jgi:hypothetical protein